MVEAFARAITENVRTTFLHRICLLFGYFSCLRIGAYFQCDRHKARYKAEMYGKEKLHLSNSVGK